MPTNRRMCFQPFFEKKGSVLQPLHVGLASGHKWKLGSGPNLKIDQHACPGKPLLSLERNIWQGCLGQGSFFIPKNKEYLQTGGRPRMNRRERAPRMARLVDPINSTLYPKEVLYFIIALMD